VTWAERVKRSYEITLVMLGLTPREFWHLTPSETADLIYAFRRRENRRLIQRAWEISTQMLPHVDKDSRQAISVINLFKQMPSAFPDDEDLKPLEPPMSEERKRRLAVKRIQRPQK
jgi:hypothetical protein